MLVTDDTMPVALMAIEANDLISCDTESTGLDVRNSRDYMTGLSFSVGDYAGYIPFRHNEDNVERRWIEPLTSLLSKKNLIWHNRKHDMHTLRTLGIDPLKFTGRQFDTMLMAHFVNEEWPSKELDWLSKILLKDRKTNKDEIGKFAKVFGWGNIPAKGMAEYATQDADLPLRLMHVLWPKIQEQELEDVYYVEERFQRLLYKMELRGISADPDFCTRKAERGRTIMDDIASKLGFNIASHLQLGRYLLEELGLPVVAHTDSCQGCKDYVPIDQHDGPPSFNKKAMEEYDILLQESGNPAAKQIATYRGWQKAVTSLYEPTVRLLGADGRIRTNFREAKTVTGRLSSAEPNMQQVPRHTDKEWNGDAKSAFVEPDDEFCNYGWDYSQLELRLGAAYGEEEWMIQEFAKADSDVFSAMAAPIFGSLTPETRHQVKNGLVYPVNYGAGLRKIAFTLGMDMERTKQVYENYANTIPGIFGISKQIDELVRNRGWVRYWDGRRRHFRNRKDSYKAWNSVLQGGAAQLVKRAMLKLEESESDDFQMVLQVHDEIVFRVKRSLIPSVEPTVREAMTNWPNFGVNLAVEGKEWK